MFGASLACRMRPKAGAAHSLLVGKQVAFRYVDDLATVWCEWAEMELRHKQFRRALDLIRRATAAPELLTRRQACPPPAHERHTTLGACIMRL